MPGSRQETEDVLRPAHEDDLPRLIDVGRRSWLSAFALTAPWELISWWVHHDRVTMIYQDGWKEMIVLERDDEIAGLVQPRQDEINGLWVDPDHQGRGAGAVLLAAGEQAIRDAGHRRAWLTCSALNMRAYRFYQRQGYVETGRSVDIHPLGLELEDIRLERELGDEP